MAWLGPVRGGGASIVALVLAAFGTSCRSEIIDHFGGLMDVEPPAVLDSATVGDTQPRVTILLVLNLGGSELRWRSRLVHAASWLSVRPDSGVAGLDSIVVEANPNGLAAGVYRDTIVVSVVAQAVAGTVPVEFRVQP